MPHPHPPHTRAALLGLGLCVAWALAGCNAKPLTEDLYTPDAPAAEPRLSLFECAPGLEGEVRVSCLGDSNFYEICSDRGVIERTGQCPSSSYCARDVGADVEACVPYTNHCEDGEPLRVNPAQLSFKDVATLKAVRRTILLTNCGPEWMKVLSVEVNWKPAYSLEEEMEELLVKPGDVVPIRVLYHPTPYASAEEGEVRVDAIHLEAPDDEAGQARQIRIPLEGRASQELPPALQEPAPTDFGFVAVGQEETAEVLIRNNSAIPVNIEWIEVEREGDANGLELILPEDERFDIAPAEVLPIQARFAPTSAGAATVRYRLWAKPWPQDLPRPVVVLRGTGVLNEDTCLDKPVPVLNVSDTGDPTIVADDWLETTPMTTILLDGRSSYTQRADAAITDYQVTLLGAPEGSAALLRASGAHPGESGVRELTLDLVGDYQIGLDVSDGAGRQNCVRRVIHVRVTPRAALHVELVWTTPGDTTRADTGAGTGADLDLHLRREPRIGDQPIPHQPWVHEPNDCYWLNPNPDWGFLRDDEEDCTVTREDRDGWGPEILELQVLEQRPYDINVHYIADHGYGRSIATLNIYLDGALRSSFVGQPLIEGDTWNVARILPSPGIIEEVNTVEHR